MKDDPFAAEQAVLENARHTLDTLFGDPRVAYADLLTQYEELFWQCRCLVTAGMASDRQEHVRLVELNEAYSRFLPKQVLALLRKNSIHDIQLGDHAQYEMAILFADIRSFTTHSEALGPDQTFDLLNAYLGVVTPTIRAHGGIIDKYQGDGIMAVFPESSDQALFAALEIQESLIAFNHAVAGPRFGLRLEVGIGLHYGSCILGTVGDAHRMDTTVISDTVNVASRIEGLTKLYRCPILLSHTMFSRVLSPLNCRFRMVDNVQLKGKNTMVTIFEARQVAHTDLAQMAFIDRFERAVMMFHLGQYAAAHIEFQDLCERYPADTASEIYRDRCATMGSNGVPLQENPDQSKPEELQELEPVS